MANVGDRVLAQWPQEMEWWYPGIVVSDGGGACVVQFDDGGRATLTPEQIRPLNIAQGDRVQCRWQGGKAFFPGVIGSVPGHAFLVNYDDGDKEVTSVCLMRVNEESLKTR